MISDILLHILLFQSMIRPFCTNVVHVQNIGAHGQQEINGVIFEGALSNLTTDSLIHCLHLCEKSSACVTILYNEIRTSCSIYDTMFATPSNSGVQYVEEAGWKAFQGKL